MKFDALVTRLLFEKGGNRAPALRSINLQDSPMRRQYKIDKELADFWKFTDAERAQYFQTLGNNGLVDWRKMNSVFLQMLNAKRASQPAQPTQPTQPVQPVQPVQPAYQ